LDIDKLVYQEVKAPGLKPDPRAGHRLCVVNEYLCILGGKDEALKSKTVFFYYNEKKNEWAGFTTDDIHDDEDFDYRNADRLSRSTKDLSNKGRSKERSKKKLGKGMYASKYSDKSGKNGTTVAQSKVTNKTEDKSDNGRTKKSSPPEPNENIKQTITEEPEARSITRGRDEDLMSGYSDRDVSGLDDTKVFKAKSLMSMKKDRIHKIREREKRELLAEFEPGPKYKYMNFFDPDFQAMSNALKVIGMPSEKIRVTERGLPILTPGISKFGMPTTSKSKHSGMPKLDSFTFFSKDYLIFIFGGDRCGLCSNDFYVIDLEEPVTGKHGVIQQADDDLDAKLAAENEEEMSRKQKHSRLQEESMRASETQGGTGDYFHKGKKSITSPAKKRSVARGDGMRGIGSDTDDSPGSPGVQKRN
jgi:hypothetical protein